MKISHSSNNQHSPTRIRAYGIASMCALLWFAFWLTAFKVQPVKKRAAEVHPAATFLPAGGESIRKFLTPTLFALPSRQGFSGTFPETNVHLDLALGQPESSGQQEFYLTHDSAERTEPGPVDLMEATPISPSALPVPGAMHTKSAPRPNRISLFLSPEIQPRANHPMHLSLPGKLPASVRVYLSIRPDGTVDQTLLETPIENSALAGAIRQFRFKPALERTDGWMDIRFTPGGDS